MNASQLKVGNYYLASEVGSSRKPVKVKVLSVVKDKAGDYEVAVETETGKDSWLLSKEDDIFSKFTESQSHKLLSKVKSLESFDESTIDDLKTSRSQ